MATSITEAGQNQEWPSKAARPLMDVLFQSRNGRVQEFVRTFGRMVRTDTPVLIVGEPGTGRELVAHALHQQSARSGEPFLKIDCQLSPKSFLEAQFDQFQTWRAGGDSAVSSPGVGSSQGNALPGTIYLHEIADLVLPLQAKALALLPDGSGDGVGEFGGIKGPRLVASSSRDLRRQMDEGRFRQDLYFGLAGVQLEIPPLRDRKDDLAELAEHFLRKYSREFGRDEHLHLTAEALETLAHYDWPGNLPELSSTMKRMVFLGSAEAALAELDHHRSPGNAGPAVAQEKVRDKKGLKVVAKEAAQRVEREMILQVLRERQWNRKRAASALNISYKTLLSKIKQLGLADEV